MKKFSLTVITVVKNDEKNIEKTIKSIIFQKAIKFEYIIVDGGSNDKTLKIIKKYKSFIKKIISEKDVGIYDAMNKGIKKSNNDIIVFCNSGDSFYKNSLKNVIKIFNEKNVDFVFGTVRRNYTRTSIVKFGFDPKRIFYNFDFATAHSTGFFLKQKIYKKIGLYDLKFRCSSDYDLYLRLIKRKFIGASTAKKDLIGNVASGGFSSKISFFSHLLEETKIRLNNNQSIFVVIVLFLNAIIKNIIKKL